MTSMSNCFAAASIVCFNPTFSITDHTSSSVCSSNGSKFVLTVPANMNGSCGIMAIFERKSLNPKVDTSTPSSTIFDPGCGSTMRNKATNMDDFPLPVRPQIPFFCPGKTVNEILLNTNGRLSRYFMLKSTISSLPLAGQFSGNPFATSGSVVCFFSNGKSKYWTTRSTAFICVSSWEAMLVPCSMYFVTSKAYTKVKPAMPASTLP
mmetsp:Transcript_6572/g.19605  ORF Transcript_6572/g.19605 Transcript_6572/m.19605 type:complete len:207 (+) Transcript_6572:1279-1899(+)